MAIDTRGYVNDTITVSAAIFADSNGLTPDYPNSASWDLVDPNGNTLILPTLPTSTIDGDIVILSQANGGFSAWDEVQFKSGQWTRIGQAINSLQNFEATLTIPGDITDVSGVYRAVARFTLPGNVRKSQLIPFEIVDPLEFAGSPPIETPEDVAIDRAWTKLEDCWDSDLGGPWLRDMTKAQFGRDKMKKLIPDAIDRINLTYYPVTSLTETSFDYVNDGPLFSQALLVEAILHLMRSYVEQPMPTGSPITWYNRRDYMDRWKIMFDIELSKLNAWLDTWKVQFFQFGSGSMLIGGYASTALRAPRALRTRLPRYYAGAYRRW